MFDFKNQEEARGAGFISAVRLESVGHMVVDVSGSGQFGYSYALIKDLRYSRDEANKWVHTGWQLSCHKDGLVWTSLTKAGVIYRSVEIVSYSQGARMADSGTMAGFDMSAIDLKWSEVDRRGLPDGRKF